MTQDTTLHATTLTQLSSREQLSALMDGALPADETRFLLRRLQHDASLAECWERWRLGGEVMRGLAPTQRLPADFASRVALALQQEGQPAAFSSRGRRPAWLRWGGGAAMAASLAVVVGFVARQPAADPVNPAPQQQVAAVSPVIDGSPVPSVPVPFAPVPQPATSDSLVAASAIAATVVRPVRNRDAARSVRAARTTAAPVRGPDAQVIAATDLPINVPQPDIVTRPWPRSVLPQFAGNALAAGFGDHGRAAAPYNPFQSPVLAEIAPPTALPATAADASVDSAGKP